MVVYVRYVELAVQLATKSELLCHGLAKSIIHKVFADFFDMMDLLSQISIMDFVVALSESEFGVQLMNESNFITKLFD